VVLDPRFDMLGVVAPALGVHRDSPWLAVAFYPEDGSPACTMQMCGLQAGLAALGRRGVALVGVSPDVVASHERFAAAHGLSFPLLADPDRALHRAFRADARSTYLLDDVGRIAHVLVDVDVRGHAAQILAAIDRLEAGPRPLVPAADLVVLRRSAG
jgi:peroxiredoxin Q/BCP